MAQQEKKDRLLISVRTVPNGYTLDIEANGQKKGFMYFNPHKLLDGFMYHVGLAEVMKAAIAWQENGKLVKLNLKYEAKIKELKTRVSTLEKQLAKKKSKEDNAGDDTPKRYRGKGKPKEKVEKLIASKSSL